MRNESRPDYSARQRVVPLVHEVYYQAFASAVAHIDPQVEMFSREEFQKEVTRLAVYCGLLALQAHWDSGENSLQNIWQNISHNISQYKSSFQTCIIRQSWCVLGGALNQRRLLGTGYSGFIQ